MNRHALLPMMMVALLGSACSSESRERSQSGPVQAGAFARVGEVALSSEVLRLVFDGAAPEPASSAQLIAQGLVHDELFRQGARDSIPHRAQAAERGILARKLLEATEAEVRAQTELKESDLERLWRERWTSYNRPRAVRTATLFLPVGRLESDAVVRTEAEAVWRAVKDTHNVEDFVLRGRGAGAVNMQAIALPPVARDGRVVPLTPQDYGQQTLEPRLAEAAAGLEHSGDISEVIPGDEGFHILFAMEIVPEQLRPLAEVRDEVEKLLLQAHVQERIEKLSRESQTPVQRKHDDVAALLRQVTQRK